MAFFSSELSRQNPYKCTHQGVKRGVNIIQHLLHSTSKGYDPVGGTFDGYRDVFFSSGLAGANPAVNTPRPSRGTRIESRDFIVLIGDP